MTGDDIVADNLLSCQNASCTVDVVFHLNRNIKHFSLREGGKENTFC